MVKKKLLPILVLVSLLVATLFLFSSCQQSTKNLKNLDFNGGTIFFNAKEYTVHPLLIAKASSFEKKIGVINNDLIVYSLKGYSSDQWLATNIEGSIALYKEKNVEDVNLNNFATKQIDILNPIGLLKLNTIKDSQIIKSLVDKAINGTPVKLPSEPKDSKILYLTSDNYPSIIYVLTYVIDKDGKKVVFNNIQENAYDVGEVISSYVN